MIQSTFLLQLGSGITALLEWFVASGALVVLVTLVYVLVLNKSPPPEGLTQSKFEASKPTDAQLFISQARDALAKSDCNNAVKLAVKATSLTLGNLLARNRVEVTNMNVSDMAYLVQSRSPALDITQHVYNLNTLRLKVAQNQSVSIQEADWAVNTANWLEQSVENGQIRL